MAPSEIEKIFRDEAGRAVAALIRPVGAFGLSGGVVEGAAGVALERWTAGELPSNARAWLVDVGRNKAIERIRRNIAFRGKQQQLVHELELGAAAPCEAPDAVLDDATPRLVFTC